MLTAFRTLVIARGDRSARVIDRNGEGSVEVGDATTCEYLPHDVDQIVARCALLLGLTETDEEEYDRLAAEVAALLLPRYVDPAGGPEPEDRLVIRPDSPWRSVPIIGGTEGGTMPRFAARCTNEHTGHWSVLDLAHGTCLIVGTFTGPDAEREARESADRRNRAQPAEADCTCETDPDSHCPLHGMTRPGMNMPRPPEFT